MTSGSASARDFAESLARGQAGEGWFLDWASARWPSIEITKAPLPDDRAGIDFFALKRSGWQVKFDHCAVVTGNVFVEIYSDLERRKRGWGMEPGSADWYFIACPGLGAIFQIRPETIRRHLASWVGRFGTKIIASRGVIAQGVAVPLEEFTLRAERSHWSPRLTAWSAPRPHQKPLLLAPHSPARMWLDLIARIESEARQPAEAAS